MRVEAEDGRLSGNPMALFLSRLTTILLVPASIVLTGCDEGGPIAATGGAGSGGTPAAGMANGGGAPSTSGGAPAATGSFELLFRDDFDTFDAARWQLMTHSWDGNLALFSTQAAAVSEGQMVLSLTPAPQGTVDDGGAAKQFLGAEVRSIDTLTYGRVRARIQFAPGSAVISSLVTIYTPWPADDWNELDIECLGKDGSVQLNTMVYLGPPTTPPVTTPVKPTASPTTAAIGFDPSADFHDYEIEWTPAGARFSIDGLLVRTWTEHIDRMKLPQNVLMTIWASGSPGWAGPVTDATGSAQARYDWIEFYTYRP